MRATAGSAIGPSRSTTASGSPGDVLEDQRALGVRGEPVDVVDLEQVGVVQPREVADLLDALGEHLAGRGREGDEPHLAAEHLVDAVHGGVVDPEGQRHRRRSRPGRR